MQEIDVPVAGGELRVVVWPGNGPLVLAAHGITGNALSWAVVARRLEGRVRLAAPDLRGRAGSAHLPGPFGMAAHAADLIAVADNLGERRFALAGHSMGGFVATETAARHPDRVAAVLLVDGGLPLAVPPGTDVDAALLAMIGPAMQRLAMTFPSFADYAAFFRRNPALGRYWSPDMDAYVRRDFTGQGSSCNVDAVRADARDMIMRPAPHDYPMLWAPRGMQDEAAGFYGREQLTGVDAEPVPDVNHYTILLSDHGAARVADRIAALAVT
jgi:pimeloyl-ACP methyl ester carboxylesterase